MSLAEKMERLARLVPGVAGYQDKEKSRDTDKSIRMRLAARLEELKRELELDKRQMMEKKSLSLLSPLDRVASQLDRLSNTVKYAARGYSSLFDGDRVDQKKLDELCAYDLQLMEELEVFRTHGERVRATHGDETGQRQAIQDFSLALDGFERVFSMRQSILLAS